MNRRAFMRLVGIKTAVAATVSPKDILAMPGPVSALDGSSNTNCEPPTCTSDSGGLTDKFGNNLYPHQVMDRFFAQRDQETLSHHNRLHHSIETKKSWSPAFKAHVHAGIARERQAAYVKLEEDKKTFKKVAKLMGLLS